MLTEEACASLWQRLNSKRINDIKDKQVRKALASCAVVRSMHHCRPLEMFSASIFPLWKRVWYLSISLFPPPLLTCTQFKVLPLNFNYLLHFFNLCLVSSEEVWKGRNLSKLLSDSVANTGMGWEIPEVLGVEPRDGRTWEGRGHRSV